MDLQGRENILQFSADDMNLNTPRARRSTLYPENSSLIPPRYLDVISPEKIVGTREMRDYT